MSAREKRKTAWRAVLIGAGVLIAFLVAGQVLLSHLGVVLALTLVALLASNRIHKILGATGANVLIRVMGLLLAALATSRWWRVSKR